MADSNTVDGQIVDVLGKVQLATMSPQVVLTSGAGKAYQSVAQSAAIAVQDAADALRNMSTIATTASGVAIAQLLATGDPKYATALTEVQTMMKAATDDFAKVGDAATTVLKNFPAG
jgi:hypothetical protein